jgi:hypothetical protein
MKIGVNLKINVSKIDKSKMFKGKGGTYLDATVFIDTVTEDQYGNHGMIIQALPKEEREAGNKGEILGNAKIFWSDNKQEMQSQPAAPQRAKEQPQQHVDFEDVPFADPYKFIRLAV